MSRVAVTNPYDLLTEDAGDVVVPAPAPKAPKPAAPAAGGAAAAKQAAKPKEAKPEAPKAGEAPKATAAAKPQQAGAAVAKPNTTTTSTTAEAAESNVNLVEHQKEGRNPAGDRKAEARKQQGAPRGDKRENDRKPGTGRPANEVKRGGQGKGNWGGEIDPDGGAPRRDNYDRRPPRNDNNNAPAAAASNNSAEFNNKGRDFPALGREQQQPAARP